MIEIFDLCREQKWPAAIYFTSFLFWLSFCPCNLTKFVPTTFGYATIELLIDGGRSENFRGGSGSNKRSFHGTVFKSKSAKIWWGDPLPLSVMPALLLFVKHWLVCICLAPSFV